MFYISLENRWYQGCYGGMKIMCFYFLIIDLKVSLNQQNILLIMCAVMNIVCNNILNVLHYMTTWCASYVGIKIMFSLFFHGTLSVTETVFYMNNRHPFLQTTCFVFRLKKYAVLRELWWCENHLFLFFTY